MADTPENRPLLDALDRTGKNAGLAASRVTEVELFCIKLGGMRCAVDAGLIQEVVRMPPITPLPGAPAFLVGVSAHRGDVVSVLDLSRFLGRGETKIGLRSRMAICQADGMLVALIADEVFGLRKFKATAMQPAPLGADGGAEFISGVIADNGTLNILDLRRALATARARAAKK